MEPKLQEVFKLSGVPTHTFVEPSSFTALRVSLDTPGRGLVIEGPSGIGKSTAVARAVEEVGAADNVLKLSARQPTDVEMVSTLPELMPFGLVLVDDFHRLPEADKHRLADLMKTLADSEALDSKLVLIGINEAGQSLINFAPDLVNRIDTIRFEIEPDHAVDHLIALGENALNVSFGAREALVQASHGSFYIAQMLCFELCIADKVLEREDKNTEVTASLSGVTQKVMRRQEDRFGKQLRDLVRGPRFRPGGRAPYLHILGWLRESETWSISLNDELAKHPTERTSVGQVVDKGYLDALIDSQGVSSILHFDTATRVLSVEDPHLIFYLRNLDWPQFVKDAGFVNIEFDQEYDVALSFAGEDREYAEHLYNHLLDHGFAIFYDHAEQHRIVSQNVEEYLGPIYESNARFVVAVLGETYGVKRWTIFESDKFKHRIDDNEVIPIWSVAIPPSAFDEIRKIGSLDFAPDGDLEEQARVAAGVIAKMIEERDAGTLPFAEASTSNGG